MRVTLKCGCKGSLNKRKKVFTFEKFCDKHMAVLRERIHKALWYGIGVPKQDATLIYGKSILTPFSPNYTHTDALRGILLKARLEDLEGNGL